MGDVVGLRGTTDFLKRTQSAAGEHPELKTGGGGGTSGGMDIVDAKIAAAEARTDVKFGELNRRLDGFATKGDIDSGRKSTINNIWGAVAVTVSAILAAIAFGGDRFDAGIGLADQRQAQLQRDNAQDAAVSEMSNKLDLILAGQRTERARK